MANITVEGDTGRLVWGDRLQSRQRIDARAVRSGRRKRRADGTAATWSTVPAVRPVMTDWRRGSSYVDQG